MEDGEEPERWRRIEELGAGGQGKTYVAENSEGQRACLKILTDGNVRERRYRFAREAACYATLAIDGVPRLIESNALGGDLDGTRSLYLCTELIAGRSLDRIPAKSSPKDEIIAAVDRLLAIVHELHSAGVVHRDIKPQNIIARNSTLTDLWLVDFGLAFSSVSRDDYRTETGQELGNRFLRLPELHAGSRTKQDPASDVTLCVGILFYLVAGLPPRTLVDEKGKMPHQRENLAGSRLLKGPEFAFLLPVFDKGFRLRVEERFVSAAELRDVLRRPAVVRAATDPTLDAIIADLNEPGLRSMQQRLIHRDVVIDTAHRTARRMEATLGGTYVYTQTGHEKQQDFARAQIGFALGQNYNVAERVPFEVRVVGSQIVATAWGEEILRADADAPDWGATLGPAVERALLVALGRLHKAREARPD